MPPYDQYSRFTRAYKSLQGLRSLPLGIFFLLMGLQQLGVTWLGEQGDCTITLPLLLACFAAWFLIGRYYARTFGNVELDMPDLKGELKIFIFPVILIAVIILENVLYRIGIPLPVSLIELTLGIGWIYAGRITSRWYYTLMGVLTVAFSFIPLLTDTSVGSRMFGTFGIAFTFFFGAAIIITALLDHFRLVGSFTPMNGDDHAGTA
jgi:hypothetical protein